MKLRGGLLLACALLTAVIGCSTVVRLEPGQDDELAPGGGGSGGDGSGAGEAGGAGGDGGSPGMGAGGTIEQGWRDAGALSCQDHEAALAGDGRVVVSGSCFLDGVEMGAAVFDPNTEMWSELWGRPPTMGSTATRLLDGRVAIAGGSALEGPLEASLALVEVGAGALSFPSALPVPRVDHAAVALPDGRLMLIGGWWEPWTTDIVDPESGLASAGPTLLEPRDLPEALWWNGTALTAGGTGVYGGPLGSVERSWDLRSWTPVVDPPRLHGTFSVQDAGADLLLFDDLAGCRLRDGVWTPLAEHGATLVSRASLRLGDGRVLLAGVRLWEGKLTTTLYEEATGDWLAAPQPLKLHGTRVTLTRLANGRVLLVGGGGAELWQPGAAPPN